MDILRNTKVNQYTVFEKIHLAEGLMVQLINISWIYPVTTEKKPILPIEFFNRKA